MRWLRRRRPEPPPAYADDGSLAVIVQAWDPARADSQVVAELVDDGYDLDRPVLVRHHLVLPDEAAVAQARVLLAPDGYALVAEPADGPWRVRASRTQLLTGLSAAQERSRMAGLAQRLGGDALGWDACAPPP